MLLAWTSCTLNDRLATFKCGQLVESYILLLGVFDANASNDNQGAYAWYHGVRDCYTAEHGPFYDTESLGFD